MGITFLPHALEQMQARAIPEEAREAPDCEYPGRLGRKVAEGAAEPIAVSPEHTDGEEARSEEHLRRRQ